MDEALQYLLDNKERLLTFLRKEIRRNTYDYETFGKKIETPLISEAISILDEGGFLREQDFFRSLFRKSIAALIYKDTISVRKRQNVLNKLASGRMAFLRPLAYRVARNKNEFPD